MVYLSIIIDIMNSRSIIVLPRLEKLLAQFGENLKLSRLRRKLTTQQVAERAGITRTTLWQIEKGAPHVSLAAYAQVLLVLGMERDLLKLATDDELGRRLQDAQLVTGKRAPKKK
jgi:transcriptional regulator with XRE-family HTH domain